MCVSVYEDWPMPPEMKENRRMEPLFRQWFFKKMTEKNPRRLDEIINEGAEIIGASTETTKRYLRKMTSNEGMYVVIKDPLGYPFIHFRE